MKPLTQLIVLIAGLVALAGVGIAGMVAIEWLRPDGHNTQLNTEIVGVVTIIAAQLFGYIKSIMNGQKIDQQSQAIKAKIDLAPDDIRRTAEVEKEKLQYTAAVESKKLIDTASSLAREKGQM